MNELSHREETNSFECPASSLSFKCPASCLSSSLSRILSSFSELLRGILTPPPNNQTTTTASHIVLIVAILTMCCCCCCSGRPLLLDTLLSPTLPTTPKGSGLQRLIDEIMSNDTTLSTMSIHHDIYRRSLERWSNPCELPGFIFDEEYLEGVPHADPVDTAQRILQATKSAKGPAQKLLKDYGMRVFHDPSYINFAIMKLNWLPEVDKDQVQHMSLRRAIKYFSDKLPYYGIALTQVTLDQVIHSGPFIEETREVEIILTQDVCQLQLGGLSLGVRPSRTQISDAMSKDYRDMKSKSQRDLRDIIILRDYNDFLQTMEDTFELIVERTLQNTATPMLDASY